MIIVLSGWVGPPDESLWSGEFAVIWSFLLVPFSTKFLKLKDQNFFLH